MISKNELKIIWSKLEKDYMKQIERIYLPTLIMMLNLTKAYNKKQILNINCGSGVGLEYLTQFNDFKAETKIYGADSNEKNLLEAYYRLNSIKNKNLTVNLNLQKKDSSIVLSRKVNFLDNIFQNKSHPYINIQLQESDYGNLTFEDKEFDVVLSNMSLSNSENPDKELSELSRVIKKDGIVAISMIGGDRDSGCLSLLPNIIEKYKNKNDFIKKPYLENHDPDKLKSIALKNCFKSINYCSSFVPFSLFTSNEDFTILTEIPYIKEILDKLDSTTKSKIINDLKAEIESHIKSEGKILSQEILILICKK